MRGRLYRCGWYPGLVPSPIDGEWVHGELYTLEDPRWILEALDSYEGSSFERVKVEVQREPGTPVLAWVYVYREPVTEAARIRSGDWLRP